MLCVLIISSVSHPISSQPIRYLTLSLFVRRFELLLKCAVLPDVLQMVKEILVDSTGRVTGVLTNDGYEIKARIVLSNATPKVTFLDLLPKGTLEEAFEKAVRQIDYTSPVTKINGVFNEVFYLFIDPL